MEQLSFAHNDQLPQHAGVLMFKVRLVGRLLPHLKTSGLP